VYICLCNALRERQVKGAITQGCCTVSEVHRKLGTQPQCGKCGCDIARLIRTRAEHDHSIPQMLPAE